MTDLINDNVILFPDEIDTNGKISYDLTKLKDTTVNKMIKQEQYSDIDCIIAVKTNADSGFVLRLASLLGKEVLYINLETGFPYYGKRKLNYKWKYVLWVDTLGYDEQLFRGLEKLVKRGLNIVKLVSLIDCHEGMKLLAEEVLPQTEYSPIYELYNLMAIYESKSLITNFVVEKCKFIADKNRKMVHAYVSDYVKMKNSDYDYMKYANKWYIDNYLPFNNLVDHSDIIPDYNNIILTYVEPCKWLDVRKELICYADRVNKIVIYPDNIDGLNLEELCKMQLKYMFNIIEYNPYNKLLDTRRLGLTSKLLNGREIKTIYDGIIFSVDAKTFSDRVFYDDLVKVLLAQTSKVLLYVNMGLNELDLRLLQELVIYSNEYMNNCIQGVIFDYGQVRDISFDKRVRLADLVPLILNVDEITVKMKDYFVDNRYTSLMLSMNVVPLERRGFNWFNSFLRSNQEQIYKLLTDVETKKKLRQYVGMTDFGLRRYLLNESARKKMTVSNESHSKIKLLNYVSPLAWYNYFLGLDNVKSVNN